MRKISNWMILASLLGVAACQGTAWSQADFKKVAPEPFQYCSSHPRLPKEVDCRCFAEQVKAAHASSPQGDYEIHFNTAAAACPDEAALREHETQKCLTSPGLYLTPGREVSPAAYCGCWGREYARERMKFAPRVPTADSSGFWSSAAKARCDAAAHPAAPPGTQASTGSVPPAPAAGPAAAAPATAIGTTVVPTADERQPTTATGIEALAAAKKLPDVISVQSRAGYYLRAQRDVDTAQALLAYLIDTYPKTAQAAWAGDRLTQLRSQASEEGSYNCAGGPAGCTSYCAREMNKRTPDVATRFNNCIAECAQKCRR